MSRLVWLPIGVLVIGIFWLVWMEGKQRARPYLYSTPDPAVEAGYCLAVAERARELTRGRGEAALEMFLSENITFWRTRVAGASGAGRAALGADLAAPGVQEQAHLHLALQDCGQRAVTLYGHRFSTLDNG